MKATESAPVIVAAPAGDAITLGHDLRDWKRRNRLDSQPKNTRRTYRAAFDAFIDYCTQAGHRPTDLVGDRKHQSDQLQRIVCEFAESLLASGAKLHTISNRVFCVVSELRAAEYPIDDTDEIRNTLRALRHRVADEFAANNYTRRKWQARPITNTELLSMLCAIDELYEQARRTARTDGQQRAAMLQRLRNRALLLIGRSGAFRRSELAKLNVGDMTDTGTALRLELHGTKTSDGETEVVMIGQGQRATTCPVRALREWQSAACISDGALFRQISKSGVVGGRLSTTSVNDVIQSIATYAGLDGITAHSLRAGFATQANRAGLSALHIMKYGRWRRIETVEGYIRDEETEAATTTMLMGL